LYLVLRFSAVPAICRFASARGAFSWLAADRRRRDHAIRHLVGFLLIDITWLIYNEFGLQSAIAGIGVCVQSSREGACFCSGDLTS
jgi:hypothetical protein